jgi:hypothetical protein
VALKIILRVGRTHGGAGARCTRRPGGGGASGGPVSGASCLWESQRTGARGARRTAHGARRTAHGARRTTRTKSRNEHGQKTRDVLPFVFRASLAVRAGSLYKKYKYKKKRRAPRGPSYSRPTTTTPMQLIVYCIAYCIAYCITSGRPARPTRADSSAGLACVAGALLTGKTARTALPCGAVDSDHRKRAHSGPKLRFGPAATTCAKASRQPAEGRI